MFLGLIRKILFLISYQSETFWGLLMSLECDSKMTHMQFSSFTPTTVHLNGVR